MNFLKIKSFVWWLLRLANYDFCPKANRFVTWIKEPIGWVVTAILFSLLVGVMIGPQGYVLAAAFTAFLVLGLVWPWVSLRGIRCSLVLPKGRVSEGEDVNVVFRVKNFWPLPVFGMMVKGDFLQELEPGAEPIAFALQHVPAWSETEFKIKVCPRRRGCLPTENVIVSNGFPFGLIDISKTVSQTESTLVWPERQSLEGFPKACVNGFSLHGALVDRSGNDGDTIGVRSYRAGDRLRNIHWAQSVRSQRLMTRERQKIVASSAMIAMDLSPKHHSGRATRSSYECAIRIAATLCNHLHESGSSVRLVCFGLSTAKPLWVDNTRGVATVFDFLAELPTLDYAHAQMLAEVGNDDEVTEVGANRLPAFGGRKFFIGTDQSDVMYIGDPETLQTIVLRLKEFSSELEDAGIFPVPTADSTNLPLVDELESGTSIEIADPTHAASEFSEVWKGRYEHAG